jgi:hypothetical protein
MFTWTPGYFTFGHRKNAGFGIVMDVEEKREILATGDQRRGVTE